MQRGINSLVKFSLKFFNYHEDNSGYRKSVALLVNNKELLKLSDVWGEITNNVRTEKDLYKNDRNEVLGTGEFNVHGYKGIVALSNSLEIKDKSKWISLDVHIIFNYMPLNVTKLDVGVKGEEWYDNHFSISPEDSYVSYTFDLPSLPWPTVSSSYASSNKVKPVFSDLKQNKFNYYNKSDKIQGDWAYGLRFVTRANNGKWPTDDELVKITDYKIGSSSETKVNGKYKLCDANINQATVNLELDNYKAHKIYPLVLLHMGD